MELRVHFNKITGQVLGYGYCDYEITNELDIKIIIAIPMDENNQNLPKRLLKANTITGILRKKTPEEINGERKL
jgi:hypothetical protein